MSKKQINNIQEMIIKFPSFQFEDKRVCPSCESCIGENCLIKQPSPFMALCSNYKFSEKKFNGEV